jgi:hypothetical protein
VLCSHVVCEDRQTHGRYASLPHRQLSSRPPAFPVVTLKFPPDPPSPDFFSPAVWEGGRDFKEEKKQRREKVLLGFPFPCTHGT